MINPLALIGAVIGYWVGFYLGGSLLGIVFALLGSSILGRSSVRKFRSSGTGSRPNWFAGWSSGTDGKIFMDNLFSMLGSLAAADGYLSPKEEAEFRSVVINQLHIIDPESVDSAMKIYHSAASGNTSISVYARRALAAFVNKRQLLEMMLLIMVRVSAASGQIHPSEDALLLEVARIFGYSQSAYIAIKRRYGAGAYSGYSSYTGDAGSAAASDSLKDAYQLLGVSSNASEADLRRAYRKRASEYHPDKIAAKGLPKEFTELANRKFQDIQKAWERIRENRSF